MDILRLAQKEGRRAVQDMADRRERRRLVRSTVDSSRTSMAIALDRLMDAESELARLRGLLYVHKQAGVRLMAHCDAVERHMTTGTIAVAWTEVNRELRARVVVEARDVARILARDYETNSPCQMGA